MNTGRNKLNAMRENLIAILFQEDDRCFGILAGIEKAITADEADDCHYREGVRLVEQAMNTDDEADRLSYINQAHHELRTGLYMDLSDQSMQDLRAAILPSQDRVRRLTGEARAVDVA